jgi:hypothetical protein
MATIMNKSEIRVLEWLTEHNIEWTKTDYGFSTPKFNIKCMTWDQTKRMYKEKNDRMVGDWDLENHIKRLDEWMIKHPVVKLEQLEVSTIQSNDKIIITAKLNNSVVAESEFWIEPDCLFWADTRYHNYHIPGWLSKTVKTINKMNTGLSIECITNSIDGAYYQFGFSAVEEVDVAYYMRRMKIDKRPPVKHPETLVMWRLRYDSNIAV